MSLEVALQENTKALNHLAGLLQEIAKGPTLSPTTERVTSGASSNAALPEVEAATKDLPQPKKKSAPPAASAPAETVSDAPPSSEPKDEAQADAESVEVTPADLRKQISAEVVRLCKAGAEQKKQAAAVLKEFGAAQVPQIKDGDLPAALAKLKAL